jgi:hypothetical protein
MTTSSKPGSRRAVPGEATIVIAEASTAGTDGMVLESAGRREVDEAYRRLGWIAAIGVGVFLITLALMLGIRFLSSGNMIVTRADIIWTIIALAGATAMLVLCHRGMLPKSWFVPAAIVFEFFLAVVFSSGLLGWQDRVASAGLTWLENSSRPPWFLGAGEIPWVAVWMILFATLVPLKPRQHLWAAAGAAATVLLFPFLSIALYGIPEVLAPRFDEVFFRVMAFLLLPTVVSLGMAYYAAKRIYGLRRDLSRAREMGSYHMVEKLGEGGMGEVWKAEHRMLARPAAIKLIQGDALKESAGSGTTPGSYLTRFEREVQATAQLQSPHTIEVYDYGITDSGTFYYVMELLDGLDLQEAIRKFGPMPPERVVMILRQACHSLAEAHQRGLVHRDIKPANIFLCRLGQDFDFVKVLDFGLVKRTGANTETHLTQVGTFAGTPAYAPPEMAGAGVDEVDGRADIYSLGCVAYWLLTGRTVFSADNALQMLVKHASEEPKPPSEHTTAPLPEELDAVILQCLAKEPGDRIATAAELSQRLASISWSDPWTDDRAQSWWREHRSVTPAAVTA